ncbi:MAG: MBOAT family O-acyltransferase [Acidobacteriota bacterium]
MIFTSQAFFVFLLVAFGLYWILPKTGLRNLALVVFSYIFYGFAHPWLCVLLFSMTLLNYACALWMGTHPARRRALLAASLLGTLGALGTFKYFNFFLSGVEALAAVLGLSPGLPVLDVLLPLGISFYSLQLAGYSIDVYRGSIRPCMSFVEFALFASFFPQIASGPIARAKDLLPQIAAPRRWSWHLMGEASELMLRGLFKKLVVADNLAVYVSKTFMLQHPPLTLLVVGAVTFAVQLFADFSGYTDMARGTARLFGFRLVENFNAPYRAVSPSDFWRRWHMSLSTWLRDYIFLPVTYRIAAKIESDRVLGMKTESLAYVCGTLVTMGLAGLWHGAAWNYIVWGLYYGGLMSAYHLLGVKGSWSPRGLRALGATALMFSFTLFGWMIFRAPSLAWLFRALAHPVLGATGNALYVSCMVLTTTAVLALPLLILYTLDLRCPRGGAAHTLFYSLAVLAIAVLQESGAQHFVYFQF